MNRLAGEPSAYLRQHAHNPVNWQPFDDTAFAEAAERGVPIFLSVGYAACHWCHVMAGESFEDPAIGAFLNEHFVPIKVDREERPDVDDAYMAATQVLSGQGGWPMSVFLTPDGRAFYAGTYFPPAPAPGQPSFRQVLEAVGEAWTLRRSEVEDTANALADALSKPMWQLHTNAAVEPAVEPGPDLAAAAKQAVTALARAEDPVHGGFGTAPKFPPTPALEFLLRHAASDAPTAGLAHGLAGRTLGAMVRSALFDRLGGGFARYSVTADWSEPHYEKMLYDNAGLLQVLVHWIRLTGRDGAAALSPDDGVASPGGPAPLGADEAREAVAATVAWLLAELRLPGGAFASSLDADTVVDGVHHEGASYTWTLDQLVAAAWDVAGGGPQAQTQAQELGAAVARFMGVDSHPPRPLHAARPLTAAERGQWDRIKPALLRMRAARAMPARDDKVVAGWNGMLMAALAEAGTVLAEPAWVAAAAELGSYIRNVHWNGQQLRRVSHAGSARGIKGLLEDYAACANGYLALYAATGERRWLDFAGELIDAMERDFIAGGTVFNHGAHADAVPGGALGAGARAGSRFADPFDNATAGGAALLAAGFTSWARYTGSARHRGIVAGMLATLPDLALRAPRSAGGMLAVAEALAAGPLEVAVVGAAGPERDALLEVVRASASPGMVVAVWDGEGSPPAPLLEGRGMSGRPAGSPPVLAYVCRNMVCARPVSAPEELRQLLG